MASKGPGLNEQSDNYSEALFTIYLQGLTRVPGGTTETPLGPRASASHVVAQRSCAVGQQRVHAGEAGNYPALTHGTRRGDGRGGGGDGGGGGGDGGGGDPNRAPGGSRRSSTGRSRGD